MRICLLNTSYSEQRDESKKEKSKGFLMTPLAERIHFGNADQSSNRDSDCCQWKTTDCLLDIIISYFSIRSGFLMTPPTQWLHLPHPKKTIAQLTRVCVRVHTRFTNKFKVRADSCVQVFFWIQKRHTRKSDKSKNGQSKGLFMTPPIEWIYFALCWPRSANRPGHFSVHQSDEHVHERNICTWCRAGFLMTPPTEWIHLENTTLEVAQLAWVCECVHTRFTKKFQVRADSCV